jgi:AcrR family transcriptional regulator
MVAAAETQIRKGRKFAQVLEGARAIFLRDGFEGASVDDIARAAGVSKATLYSYFPDKRLLFTEICLTECRRQADEAEAEIAPGLPVEQALSIVAMRFAAFFLSEFGQQSVRLMIAEATRFPDLAREFYRTGPGLIHERLAQRLGDYVARGELRIDDLPLAAEQFAQLSKGYIFERLMLGMAETIKPVDVQRGVRGAVEMFMARYGVPA